MRETLDARVKSHSFLAFSQKKHGQAIYPGHAASFDLVITRILQTCTKKRACELQNENKKLGNKTYVQVEYSNGADNVHCKAYAQVIDGFAGDGPVDGWVVGIPAGVVGGVCGPLVGRLGGESE